MKQFTTKLDEMKKNENSYLPRYSDEDLKFFEDLLLEKRKVAQTELSFLIKGVPKKDGPMDACDAGGLAADKEKNACLRDHFQIFIIKIDRAILRIKNGTYGVCINTGKLIPKERLLLVPHATSCVEAKRNRK